jgi:hypothetical protein
MAFCILLAERLPLKASYSTPPPLSLSKHGLLDIQGRIPSTRAIVIRPPPQKGGVSSKTKKRVSS